MPHGEPRSPTLNSESRSPKSEGVKTLKSKVQGGQNPEVQSPGGSKTRSPKSKVPRGRVAGSWDPKRVRLVNLWCWCTPPRVPVGAWAIGTTPTSKTPGATPTRRRSYACSCVVGAHSCNVQKRSCVVGLGRVVALHYRSSTLLEVR